MPPDECLSTTGPGKSQLQHGAGIAHGQRQAHGLLARHAFEENGHGKGCNLTFRHSARGEAGDEVFHLIG